MLGKRLIAIALVTMAAGLPATAKAQGRPDPATLIAAQKEAMAQIKYMDGVWRGPAWTILPSGQKHDITQTERIGPFLDGSLRVIEGKGYETNGTASGFNALGVISYNVDTKVFSMRSYAMGYAGDFVLALNADGFVWEIPAGPGMTIRYTATVKNGTWREVGDRIATGKDPVRFFEMNLKRVGDTTWPAGGAISPK